MAAKVFIRVNGLSGLAGHSCLVEASTDSTIMDVHAAIREKLHLPITCQALIKPTDKLGLEATVGTLLNGRTADGLDLTLVVNSQLDSQSWRTGARSAVEATVQGPHDEAIIVLQKEVEQMRQRVDEAKRKLEKLREDLCNLCLDPITFRTMCRPVMGTDSRTYEKDVIEEVLATRAMSPFTRSFMDKRSLRPNLLAADLLELVRRHFPDWEAPPADVGSLSERQLVASELILALQDGDSDQVLELLGRDVDDSTLNCGYNCGPVRMNLLQISLSLYFEPVALAILSHKTFRRVESFSSEGLLAIHMAAAFNYVDVLYQILADAGPFAMTQRTLRAARLIDENGREELIPEGSTALDCSRLFGHEPLWAGGLGLC